MNKNSNSFKGKTIESMQRRKPSTSTKNFWKILSPRTKMILMTLQQLLIDIISLQQRTKNLMFQLKILRMNSKTSGTEESNISKTKKQAW